MLFNTVIMCFSIALDDTFDLLQMELNGTIYEPEGSTTVSLLPATLCISCHKSISVCLLCSADHSVSEWLVIM